MEAINKKPASDTKPSFSTTVLIFIGLGIPLAFLRAWCIFKIQDLFSLPFGLSINQWVALSIILTMLKKPKIDSDLDNKSNLQMAGALMSTGLGYLIMLGIAYAYYLIIN